MRAVGGTVFGRWYVTIFGLTYLWFAVRHLGWRRTAGVNYVRFTSTAEDTDMAGMLIDSVEASVTP